MISICNDGEMYDSSSGGEVVGLGGGDELWGGEVGELGGGDELCMHGARR